MAEHSYDTVVVGGGIAGLNSAAYLAKKGQNVLLIEKNDECGGLVSTFDHNGFRLEGGVRALLDAGIILPMLKELDIELEVVKSHVSVGIGKDIMNVEDIHSLEDYKQLLLRNYPESEEDIEKILKVIRKIMKHMDVLYGIENPIILNIWKEIPYVFTRLLPWLPRFLFTIRKINRMNMPVEDYLAGIIKDSSLRDIISQHFFRNTPTFFALSYFSLYLDYFYPKGGVGTLAKAVEKKVLEFGGEIKYETTIQSVVAGEKKVIDEIGQAYHYKNLIWAADLKTFYRNTDTGGLKTKIQSAFESTKLKMLERRGGDSVYSLYLELDEPLENFRKIANGHFFYTPLKEGLGQIHRAELDELLSNWDKVSKEQLFEWLDRFTRLNTYEISIPGLKDESMVPEGKTGMIISFLTEYDLFRNVKERGWHEEFIPEIERMVVKVISDSVYPQLKKKILHQFSFNPLSIENRVGTSEGAITGWSFQEPVPVIHKMQQSGRSMLTPIPSIYQAGQWSYSPAGVPMSILSGKLAADRILKKG